MRAGQKRAWIRWSMEPPTGRACQHCQSAGPVSSNSGFPHLRMIIFLLSWDTGTAVRFALAFRYYNHAHDTDEQSSMPSGHLFDE